MEKIDTNKTYLVDGKHKVLGLFQDSTQRNTMHEYVVVWEQVDIGSLQVARVDSNGRAFGQGFILKEVTFHREDYNMSDEAGTVDENSYCPCCGNIVTYTDDGRKCDECKWSSEYD